MARSAKPLKLIINADDFGMSTESNRAIIEAFQKELISSTTLMANMPAFEEACHLAHAHGLLGKIGVHLNLTAGRPLSDPIRECVRLCDENGMFRPRRLWFRMSRREALAVRLELDAQVKACIDRGVFPTHLDSHHHIHTEWSVGTIVIAIARRYGIHSIRLSRNCGAGIGLTRRLYKWAYNTRLKRCGVATCQYFGSVSDVRDILSTASDDVEVMVHLTAEEPSARAEGAVDLELRAWPSSFTLASYS